jgi:predicted phage tail protein
MIIIYFPKILQKFTDVESIKLAVNTYSSLKEALKELFPKYKKYLTQLKTHSVNKEFITLSKDKKTILEDKWLLRDKIESDVKELWVLPSICGGGGKSTGILIGIALIALAIVTAGAAAPAGAGLLAGFGPAGGLLGSIAKITLGIGLNLLLGSLFSQSLKPKLDKPSTDADTRRNNDLFDGLQNTTSSNQIIMLNYGLMRVSGQFISGYVKTLNHGQADIITVASQFT